MCQIALPFAGALGLTGFPFLGPKDSRSITEGIQQDSEFPGVSLEWKESLLCARQLSENTKQVGENPDCKFTMKSFGLQ